MNHRTASPSSATPEELIANIHRLMDEVEAIVARPENAIVDGHEEGVVNLRDRLSAALDRLNDMYCSARNKVVEGARRTDESIRSHPYQSLAIALGVGVLVGVCVRRRD